MGKNIRYKGVWENEKNGSKIEGAAWIGRANKTSISIERHGKSLPCIPIFAYRHILTISILLGDVSLKTDWKNVPGYVSIIRYISSVKIGSTSVGRGDETAKGSWLAWAEIKKYIETCFRIFHLIRWIKGRIQESICKGSRNPGVDFL